MKLRGVYGKVQPFVNIFEEYICGPRQIPIDFDENFRHKTRKDQICRDIHLLQCLLSLTRLGEPGYIPTLKAWSSGPGQSKMAMPNTYDVE